MSEDDQSRYIGAVAQFDNESGYLVSESFKKHVHFSINDITVPKSGRLTVGDSVDFTIDRKDGKIMARNLKVPSFSDCADEKVVGKKGMQPSHKNKRLAGTVTRFNASKGFGFVSVEGYSKLIFVHDKDVKSMDGKVLDAGDSITCAVEEVQDGRLNAVDVQMAGVI